MRKLFTFLCAALMSVGMFADPNILTPTISGETEFTDSVIVTMECTSPNSDIYYTTDGVTDPKCDCAAAPEYKKPIVIKETTVIKAAAFDGNDWSAVAEKTFTKVPAPADPNREYFSLDPNVWTWGYNSVSVTVADGLQTTVYSDYGAVSMGWDPERDLTEWDKIVFEVSHMDGCEGQWWKLKAYLRDASDSEGKQMEGFLGNEAPDNELNYLVIDLHQQVEGFDLTKARVLAVQCQPTGGIFTISSAYLLKEEAPTTYTLQLVADPEKGSVAVTNLLGSDIIDNGNGNYTVPENAEVTILATPLEGYEFSGWKTGNIDEMVGCYYCGTALNTNDNPYTFTMTADVAYLAEFEEAQGIENIVLTEKAKKVVVDGVLYIVRDGKMFNATGAQVR